MGYNQTCAVSQYPISYDEPVVGILIVEKTDETCKFPTGFSGTGAEWEIGSLPFYGRYNDYGSVLIDDAEVAESISHKAIGKNISEMSQLLLETRDPINIRNYKGKNARVSLALIHRKLWDELANKPIGFLQETSYTEEKNVIPDLLDVWRKDTAKRWSEFPLSNVDRQEVPALDMPTSLRATWWKSGNGNKRAKVLQFISGESSVYFNLIMSVTERLSNLLKEGNNKHAEAILEECMRVSIVNEAMGFLNRGWRPQQLGSDDKKYELHNALAQWVYNKANSDYNDDHCDEEYPLTP